VLQEHWNHGEAPWHSRDHAGGAALCFRAFCPQGASTLGPHEHPDVTLDCGAVPAAALRRPRRALGAYLLFTSLAIAVLVVDAQRL
jgi:hypothetical protein